MAMQIEKNGINLAAIYRPLNNSFLNPLMENIRKKYICKKQIKKGVSGTKEILKHFKNGTSVALMIDQRVTQGIKSLLFNEYAYTIIKILSDDTITLKNKNFSIKTTNI